MNVTIEFQYTRKELLNALSEVYFNRTLILPVLAIVFALIGFLLNQNYLPRTFWLLPVLLIIMYIITMFVFPNTMYKNESKYNSKYILTFSHDYIQGTMGDLEFKAEWGYFKRARESKEFYFLLWNIYRASP